MQSRVALNAIAFPAKQLCIPSIAILPLIRKIIDQSVKLLA